MYNTSFAHSTIGSALYIKLAKDQVRFLISVLALPANAKILDVPCGVGRHAKVFAQRGYKVTGIDISRDCLGIAKRKSKHKNAIYRLGDMGQLKKYAGQFDLCVNLFTSFGYFADDVQNKRVLSGMVKTLKPGGKLVLNLIDRDWILKIYKPARWSEIKGVVTFEASIYNPKTKYNESHMAMVDLKRNPPSLLHHHYHRIRLYSKSELVRLMKSVGLKNIQVYGDYKGNAYKKGQSTHPIYIGQRP